MVTILYKCDMCGKVVEEKDSGPSYYEHAIFTDKLYEELIGDETVEICNECKKSIKDKILERYKEVKGER